MQLETKSRRTPFSVLGCTNRVWFELLKRYGFDAAHFPRVVFATMVTLLLTPLRWYEQKALDHSIDQCRVHESPVFIIGHWRSGTTLLHNVLSKDPQFGYVTYSHGLFPHCFLKNSLIAYIAQKVMPGTRPMDNMEIDINKPQEEEQALIALCGHSFYNMWICPSRQLECWNGYGLLGDSTMKEQWCHGYNRLLKSATYHFGGRRLLLKNPTNTARIPYLLEQFPNARFIYIYRNPYAVLESTKNLYRKVGPYFQLRDAEVSQQDENIVHIYREMIESYHSNRHLIPQKNLIEIKYEEFVPNQKAIIKSIYEKLGLGNYHKAEAALNAYLESIKDYQPNSLPPTPDTIELVNTHLAPVFDHYHYQKTTTTKDLYHV